MVRMLGAVASRSYMVNNVHTPAVSKAEAIARFYKADAYGELYEEVVRDHYRLVQSVSATVVVAQVRPAQRRETTHSVCIADYVSEDPALPPWRVVLVSDIIVKEEAA